MMLTDHEKNLLRTQLKLTERQAQIVELLFEKIVESRDIAAAMRIDHRTVSAYLQDIYMKLGINNKVALVLYVLEQLR